MWNGRDNKNEENLKRLKNLDFSVVFKWSMSDSIQIQFNLFYKWIPCRTALNKYKPLTFINHLPQCCAFFICVPCSLKATKNNASFNLDASTSFKAWWVFNVFYIWYIQNIFTIFSTFHIVLYHFKSNYNLISKEDQGLWKWEQLF